MKKIKQHPVLLYSQDFKDICKPLLRLNISYFSHVHVDKSGRFSAASNNPEYHKLYLEQEYYNTDIHMLPESMDNYFLWDSIECTGDTLEMHEEGEALGVRHPFTIIKKNEHGTDYYHFATHRPGTSINQVYLSELELLNLFIQHFNSTIRQSKILAEVYNIKFGLDYKTPGFTYQSDLDLLNNAEQRAEFLRDLTHNQPIRERRPRQHGTCLIHNDSQKIVTISKQQLKCLQLLIQGYTSKEAAALLYLAPRTVNSYLEILRDKLDCRNSKELITKYHMQITQHSGEFPLIK
jgi:DNA-binding CsgD family transcriptional regulator